MTDFIDDMVKYDEQEGRMETDELPDCNDAGGCAKELAGKCHSSNKCKYQLTQEITNE